MYCTFSFYYCSIFILKSSGFYNLLLLFSLYNANFLVHFKAVAMTLHVCANSLLYRSPNISEG